MTKKSLLAMLGHLPDDCEVVIYNAESQQAEGVTGCTYGPNPGERIQVELHSDDIS